MTDGSGDTAKLSFNGSYTLAKFQVRQRWQRRHYCVRSAGLVVLWPRHYGAGTGVRERGWPREIPDLTALPDLAFNLQSARGHLLDSNAAGGIMPCVEGVPNANIALLGEYMASTFAMVGNHGAATTVAEMAQANDQPVLGNPGHA